MANATLRYQEFRSMANATLRYQEFRSQESGFRSSGVQEERRRKDQEYYSLLLPAPCSLPPITHYPFITYYPFPIYLTLNLLAVANKSCAIPVKLWKTLAISWDSPKVLLAISATSFIDLVTVPDCCIWIWVASVMRSIN
jgi:hypothetical protein